MATLVARRSDRAALVHAGILLASVAALGASIGSDRNTTIAAGGTIVLAALLVSYHWLLRWQSLVGAIVLIILFIPIRRYKLAAGLPFDLEPYRLAVAFVVALWVAALLSDRRVRLRRSFVDGPILLFMVAVVGSIVTNILHIATTYSYIRKGAFVGRQDLSGDVLKKILFLASFFLVFYLTVSVVTSPAILHSVLKTIVGGCTVVAFFGIVEARTNYNVFDHLGSLLPMLDFQGALKATNIARAGRLRVYASAEHPIALAAMFAMVFALAIYLAKYTGKRRWVLSALIIGLGALSTVSRTSVTMLATVAIVLAVVGKLNVKKLWPFVLPALVVIHLALPGTIGGLRYAFFPRGGLVQDQTVYGGRLASERLDPEYKAIKANPLFGQGYGTRITDGERQNARVLDNEWLGTASETGFAGVFARLWFFVLFVRRLGREAKRDPSPRGFLLAALAAAAAAFAVGMLTYDALSFVQVTFVLFFLAGLGASAVKLAPWTTENGDVAVTPARPRLPLSFRQLRT